MIKLPRKHSTSGHHRHRRADDGIIDVWILSPLIKKKFVKAGLPLTKLSGSADDNEGSGQTARLFRIV